MSHIEDLIQRYFDSKVSNEERHELLRLIRGGHIEEDVKYRIAQTLLDEIHSHDSPDFKAKATGEEIFKLIARKNALTDERIFNGPTQRQLLRKSPVNYNGIMRYAAAFIILGAACVFVYSWNTPSYERAEKEIDELAKILTVSNSGTTTQKVLLQDGSTIMLEPGGEIRYAEKFATEREVYLIGDAFFNVAKDPAHPFLVYANEITTKVLGTSFRVKANQGEKEIVVAVKTGKVSVFARPIGDDALTKNVQEITLTPNQQATYKRTEHVVEKKLVEQPQVISAQATLKDSYINEPVVLILEALSQSYGVDIRFDRESLSDCTLTSDIIEGEGLYDQLEIVCNALGGTYKMENDASIVIEAGGCRSINVKP